MDDMLQKANLTSAERIEAERAKQMWMDNPKVRDNGKMYPVRELFTDEANLAAFLRHEPLEFATGTTTSSDPDGYDGVASRCGASEKTLAAMSRMGLTPGKVLSVDGGAVNFARGIPATLAF